MLFLLALLFSFLGAVVSTRCERLRIVGVDKYPGDWYRKLPLGTNVDDPDTVITIHETGYITFGHLSSEPGPSISPEDTVDLCNPKQFHLLMSSGWRRMPTARVTTPERVNTLSFPPHLTVRPPRSAWTNYLPLIPKHPPPHIKGTWYRAGITQHPFGDVIKLVPNENPRVGRVNNVGKIDWRPDLPISPGFFHGGWLLWPVSPHEPLRYNAMYIHHNEHHNEHHNGELAFSLSSF